MPIGLLKKRLDIAAAHAGVAFNSTGIADFFLEPPTGTPEELFAKAILHFCQDDGRWTNQLWALSGAFAFIYEALNADLTDGQRAQALAALASIVRAESCTEKALIAWAKSWLN